MRLAVIPARGGSKRIPRKNIRPFCGKPMIAYSIEAAWDSGCFDHVVVSTDDEEIAAIARAYGAETPFRRPDDLAEDHAPTVPVVHHAVGVCRALGWQFEHVCCIYPAVPFLRTEDLRAGLDHLIAADQGFVFPVVAFPSPIQRALRRDEQGNVTPFDPRCVAVRTQDLTSAYYDAGQFYWGRAASWQPAASVHLDARTLVLPAWRAIDIDTADDWQHAELLFKAGAA